MEQRSEQNDLTFKAQTEDDREAKKVESKKTKREGVKEEHQGVIKPNEVDSKATRMKGQSEKNGQRKTGKQRRNNRKPRLNPERYKSK